MDERERRKLTVMLSIVPRVILFLFIVSLIVLAISFISPKAG
jgi:cell division protein FtsL